jgi:hypothetical protein
MRFVVRWTKVLAAGLLAGLVAALFMMVVLVLLRLFVGVGLPVELGGDRFLPTFDVKEFLRLLGNNGGPVAAKRKALTSGFGGQLSVGVAFGVVYALIAELGRRRDPERPRPLGVSISGALFVGVTLVVIWAVTLAVLWPTLGTNNRGLLTSVASVVTAVGYLVLFASYGITLILAYRFITSRSRSANRRRSENRSDVARSWLGLVAWSWPRPRAGWSRRSTPTRPSPTMAWNTRVLTSSTSHPTTVSTSSRRTS